ncbi:sigma factor-like helix-turn-helix DNA-binding protein [Plantactinospora sp. KBS50]|uniref:sigma factor-like helix-turn-helix DNA-binding protein n=1 Tax=Plantactinospora sp. KBS50 TaxID=2024580 RepID=UPI0012FD2CC9|nr:sigma factor-like helix-turn-helix DNA-binding protein [Plantactinospora sp. KBS50]
MDPDAVWSDTALADAIELAETSDDELEGVLRQIAPHAPAEDQRARAARVEADRLMVQACAKENFEGPMTKKLLLVAHEYATPVISFLITNGTIFKEAIRLRRPVRRDDRDLAWTVDERNFLTHCTVDTGIFGLFCEYGLRQGRWDHRRGVKLTTYATNGCIMCFSSVYPKWWSSRAWESGAGLAVDFPQRLQIDRRAVDPAEQAVNRVEAMRLLREFPEQERTALVLRGEYGVSQSEAAALVGLTPKALESRLGRSRRRLELNRSDPSHVAVSAPELDIEL